MDFLVEAAKSRWFNSDVRQITLLQPFQTFQEISFDFQDDLISSLFNELDFVGK